MYIWLKMCFIFNMLLYVLEDELLKIKIEVFLKSTY